MLHRLKIVFAFTLSLIYNYSSGQASNAVVKTIHLDKVWSGHPVGFDLLTTVKYQYAAYYNADRDMVIARRSLNSDQWEKTKLPTSVGWDSHNYIAMTTDQEGYIHISGNMHGVPLIYFRSSSPWEIDQFEKLPMTGRNEDRVTYPVFFKDHDGVLYFQYRNGGSGDGITYWNRYDVKTKKWESLFESALFDGESEANAYMTNPTLGPDGYFYIVWMWRLTPVANTNHNLSCMRSKDLRNWENMRGDKVTLPVKWSDDLTTVDPVGPWNGLINMGFNISFDNNRTPHITYHKYDDLGVSQVYISRWEVGSPGRWKSYQISNWKDFKWSLNKRGSLSNSLSISPITQTAKNEITVSFVHEKEGRGRWVLDASSLKIKRTLPAADKGEKPKLPSVALNQGMQLMRKGDNTGNFVLQWQTLPANQDRPRPGTPPDPVELVVVQIN